MPLPRTDTLQLHDWCVALYLGSVAVADEAHIPMPFAGYLERLDWISEASPNANLGIDLSLNGGSPLESITVPSSTPALVAHHEEYTQPGSPIQFAEGDVLVINTDGLPTNTSSSNLTLVLKRL